MPAEFGGEIHNVSRNRARTQVLPQAQKSHFHGSGTFGAFWSLQNQTPQREAREPRDARWDGQVGPHSDMARDSVDGLFGYKYKKYYLR